MSESNSLEINGGRLQNYTVDQLAGAIALTLGALGSLLLVIWQSRCLCRCRIGISDQCYLFDCSREPPPIEHGSDDEGEETLVPPKTKKKKVDEPQPESEPEPDAIP
jgi:hypothetical protein